MKISSRLLASSELRCAICHDALTAALPRTECPRCRTSFHADCWKLVGRCPSLGCEGPPWREPEGAPSASGAPSIWSVLVATALLAIVGGVAMPNIVHSHRCGNESWAIGALKTIATSEAIYREGDKEEDGNLDYGMLSELNETSLVDPVLGSGTSCGYLFQASYSFLSSEFLWFAVANPALPGTTGDRYFATNQAGVIFYTTGANLALDTSTCALPANGVIPCGK